MGGILDSQATYHVSPTFSWILADTFFEVGVRRQRFSNATLGAILGLPVALSFMFLGLYSFNFIEN